MAYKSLRDFIAMLEEAGDLKRITAPVSTDLEMIHGSLRVMWDTADENLALVSISVPVTAGNAHAKVIAFYSSCFDAATSITDADEPVDCF